MFMFATIFDEIATLLRISTALGVLALWLRQPLIVTVVGLLIGVIT